MANTIRFIKVLATFENLTKTRDKPAVNQIFRQIAYEKVAWVHGRGADPRNFRRAGTVMERGFAVWEPDCFSLIGFHHRWEIPRAYPTRGCGCVIARCSALP